MLQIKLVMVIVFGLAALFALALVLLLVYAILAWIFHRWETKSEKLREQQHIEKFLQERNADQKPK